uniref:Nicotinamide riboside kinase 1 n=1 Tax=Crocodylus porosus TaxID=8502 RepID=A0A7M4FUP9_CROPO
MGTGRSSASQWGRGRWVHRAARVRGSVPGCRRTLGTVWGIAGEAARRPVELPRVERRLEERKWIANYETGCWPWRPEYEVETDERGFKQYDVLDALYMEEMVKSIHAWIENSTSSSFSAGDSKATHDNLRSAEEIHILIVEGFLLYNYEPLNELWNRRYFITLSYEECKRRRSTRVYQPADPPGYFDGHVWPMYLKHKSEFEEKTSNIVYLDGMESQEELLLYMYNDIIQELEIQKSEQVTA